MRRLTSLFLVFAIVLTIVGTMGITSVSAAGVIQLYGERGADLGTFDASSGGEPETPVVYGKFFGGWYADEDFTTPITDFETYEGDAAYARISNRLTYSEKFPAGTTSAFITGAKTPLNDGDSTFADIKLASAGIGIYGGQNKLSVNESATDETRLAAFTFPEVSEGVLTVSYEYRSTTHAHQSDVGSLVYYDEETGTVERAAAIFKSRDGDIGKYRFFTIDGDGFRQDIGSFGGTNDEMYNANIKYTVDFYKGEYQVSTHFPGSGRQLNWGPFKLAHDKANAIYFGTDMSTQKNTSAYSIEKLSVSMESNLEFDITFLDENGRTIETVQTVNQLVTPPAYIPSTAGKQLAGWLDENGEFVAVSDLSNTVMGYEEIYTAAIWDKGTVEAEEGPDGITITASNCVGASTAVMVELDDKGNPRGTGIISASIATAPTLDGCMAAFENSRAAIDNNSYRIIILNEENKPISDVWCYDGTDTVNESGSATGGAYTKISDVSHKSDAFGKVVYVSGTYQAGKAIAMTIYKDGTLVGADGTICDNKGKFTIPFNYSDDADIAGLTYEAKLYDNGVLLETVPKLTYIYPVTTDISQGAITDIKALETAEDLITYLGETNPDAADVLGVELEGSFKKLKEENKLIVMTELLNAIKADSTSAVSDFNSRSNNIYREQKLDDALTVVNGSVSSSIGGFFEEYNDVLFDADLWGRYTDSNKKKKIHDEFIDLLPCTSLENIAENFEEAIDEAHKTIGGGGGGGESSGGRDDKKDDEGGTTYQAPKEPVEVYKPIQPKTFADVPVTHWAYEPITILATRGVINGMGDGNYAPETDLTREAFVKMLVEALGIKASGNALAFTDVADNEWYTNAVNIASSIGLVNGYDGKFGIGDGLTREQMATMLYRATQIANIKLEDKAEAKEFTDNAEIGDYALEAVKELCEAGIIDGMGDGSYSPKTICNRAMAAKVLYEILALQ